MDVSGACATFAASPKSLNESTSLMAVSTTSPIAAGTRYFQHKDIIWSTRMRGNVQRIQITTFTSVNVLLHKTRVESTYYPQGTAWAASLVDSHSVPRPGTCHPPRKSVVSSALITQRFPHSARK